MITEPTNTRRGRYRKPRNHKPLAILAAVVTALLVLLVACSADEAPADAGTTTAQQVSTNPHVLYEVEGTADSASITMNTATGTSQVTTAVPMTSNGGDRGVEGTVPPGTFVYISAQNDSTSGDITCRITVDGVVISENSSSDGYTIASCDGVAR